MKLGPYSMNLNHIIKVRIDDSLFFKLHEISVKLGITKSKFLRGLLKDALG